LQAPAIGRPALGEEQPRESPHLRPSIQITHCTARSFTDKGPARLLIAHVTNSITGYCSDEHDH
jgi:hypothetical protein